MIFTIKKARFEQWGYEITANGYHNIAPTAEAAENFLTGRYGRLVQYRVVYEDGTIRKHVIDQDGNARFITTKGGKKYA